jgi:hypothetical protein
MTQLHPVLGCVAVLDAALKDVADLDPTFMRTDDKAAALLALTRLAGRVEELRDRVLATAADVAAEEGARDAAAWLAHHARLSGGEARRAQRLAAAGVEQWAGLARARREGEVTTAQAHTIHRALADLPPEVDDDVRLAPRSGSCARPPTSAPAGCGSWGDGSSRSPRRRPRPTSNASSSARRTTQRGRPTCTPVASVTAPPSYERESPTRWPSGC